MSGVASETTAKPLLAGPGSLYRAAFEAILGRIAVGHLSIVDPTGGRSSYGSPGTGLEAELVLHAPSVYRRLLLGGSVGFAEAFMEGAWSSPDIVALLRLADANMQAFGAWAEGLALLRGLDRLRHKLRPNTRRGSRRNIAYHYDLGNEFYRRWLDGDMHYSSGIFRSEQDSLEAAQRNKLERIADLLGLEPGGRVLEIGCGWGALADMLTRERGQHVTGLTLSREQLQWATARLGDTADLRLQDYRDVEGSFDRIVSIEMIEAVGESNWDRYFSVLHDRLRPGGIAVLQAITIEDARYENYRRSADFIQRYIFPGGMLPTPGVMARLAEKAGMVVEHTEHFGLSYADTLARWRDRFEAAWSEIRPLGFDERFKKMWIYYLGYCEAGFRNRAVDVGLYRLRRP